MDDSKIIQLYFERNEQAISATYKKYGNYCASIAKNILGNSEDVNECVNDALLNTWNSIPPHKPNVLPTFLGKITRNISFNKYKHNRVQKRGGCEMSLVLDELADVVSGNESVEQTIDSRELTRSINGFLYGLDEKKRNIFVRRYWYADSVSEIAKCYSMTPASISKELERMRKKLSVFLTERGFSI